MRAPAPATPAVSVVVPTYRRPHMIADVIASVANQSFAGWELVIVDDNGAGNPAQVETQAIVERYSHDNRIIYVLHEQNRGACAARNTGLRLARGTYVAFLDDDDVWHPRKLERQVACFADAGPDVALVYGGWRYVYSDGTLEVVKPDGSAHRPPMLLKRNGIGSTSLVMCRRTALLEIDGFDERLPAMQDFDLYIRLGLRYPFAFVDHVLMDYRPHEGPRITTDPTAVETANERFHAKHAHLFEADPDIHHHRLRAYAYDMLGAGQYAKARSLYRSAWRVRPGRLDTLVLGLLTYEPLIRHYRRLKRSFRPTTSRSLPRPVRHAPD